MQHISRFNTEPVVNSFSNPRFSDPYKPRLPRALGLVLLTALLAGCPAPVVNKVVIRGSNTVGEELAPRLVEAFRKAHPGVAFDLEFKGTAYGMGALLGRGCDLAAASRPATKSELEISQYRGVQIQEHVIGSYAVAVVVHAASPVADLTTNQVRDIFTGMLTNWKEAGGPDAPIHLYVRDPISGTHLGFQEVAMEKKPYASNFKTFTNYAGLVAAVAADPHGIGYAGLDLGGQSGAKAVRIGGVTPDAATVNAGNYPYARALRFFTRQGEAGPALAFMQFVQSPAGQKVVAQTGDVPKP